MIKNGIWVPEKLFFMVMGRLTMRLLIHYAFLTYRLSSHNGKPPVWHAAKFYFSRERLDYLVVGSVADTTWCDIHKITPGDFMKKCVYEECVYEKVFVKKCVLCH